MRLANGLLGAAQSLGMARTSLDEQELLAAARKATGLQDFGTYPETFEQMRILLNATEAEAHLTPCGRLLVVPGYDEAIASAAE